MRHRVRAVAGALLLTGVLGTAGCSGSSGNRPSFAPTTVTRSSASTTSPAGPSAALEVLDRGAEPRRKLRLVLQERTTSTVAITTDLRLSQDSDTGPVVIDPPPFTQIVSVRAGPTRSDGAIVNIRIEDVVVARAGTDLTGAEALRLTQALQPIKGLEATGRLNAIGRLSNVDFRVPKAVPAAVRTQVEALPSQLAELVPTLPREAVGVGASWRSRSTRSVAGVDVDQDDTFTLTAIDANLITYRSSSTTTAGQQSITESKATRATLLASSGTGSGSGTVDLSTLAATASIESSTAQRVRVRAGSGPADDVKQKVVVVTRIRDRSS